MAITCNTTNIPGSYASQFAALRGQQATFPIKKAVKVESANELRKKLKAAEKRERQARKEQKRAVAEKKAAEKRRQVALDALVKVAKAGGPAATPAAKILLELG